MNNYLQPGDVMDLPAPYDRTSGQGALIGGTFCVAENTVASGVVGPFVTRGVFNNIAKATGAWSVGDLLYWDDSAKNLTKTSTSNHLAGYASAVAASGDTVGSIRANGIACIAS